MSNLNSFTLNIPKFNDRTSSEFIPIFAYYLQEIKQTKPFSAIDINYCFNELSLKPYSNISAFLTKKSKGKDIIFLKQKTGYTLTRHSAEKLAKELSMPIDMPVSTALIDLTIFKITPYYLQKNAKQMAQCYECGFYDATLVLMRKLLETLIIESFERHGIDHEIKDNEGMFFYLSGLIPLYLKSKKWNCSRNLQNNIIKIKKYGDLSAHNRRFLAKKTDIDDFKFELRQVLEEIILSIDYYNWDRTSN
ncbi:hypothetical protein [Listeria monocytogenes]|uniref:hypothetical protein n=1 Tax=Listeria monocytogenes TaxID=1639 RepID=UPI00085C22E0|nr:hypothetical protein [Listeria monocytogenes]EEP3929333.1 hypothetical protein [Listeria monocytogenes serotype 4ab]EAC3816212.1 hypothetical protein [Listeria monocytogenes]EAC3918017.1 hypothetical protein [Listeria monocytogenes]EAC7896366.1 hypothetical protein [Listeria monocytogenes]EAF3351937.1 hypothetical protein [Listeria monocytogenes]